MDVYLASQAAGLAARTLGWEGDGGKGQLYLRIGRGGGREVCIVAGRNKRFAGGVAYQRHGGESWLDMASQLPYNLAPFTL